MRLKIIGRVRNKFKAKIPDNYGKHHSQIRVYKKYEKGLEGLEENSHIIVLFWMDKVKDSERMILKVHPMKDDALPLKGVFATRTPSRPNPIGLTIVKLVKKDRNTLTVLGLDALDGSPVIDLKPYLRDENFTKHSRVPK